MTRKALLFLIFLLVSPRLPAQSWWGNFCPADATYSSIFYPGDRASFRFTAPSSGSVTAAAFAVTFAFAPAPSYPVTGVGTAGFQADDGSGSPTGVFLASSPLTLTGEWTTVTVPPVPLSAGVTYHFVVDVAGSAFNLKLNDLFHEKWIPTTGRMDPGWATLADWFGGGWIEQSVEAPFLVFYSSGVFYGNAYNDNSPYTTLNIGGGAPLFELHDNGTPSVPSDDRCIGQVFRAPGSGICEIRSFQLKDLGVRSPFVPLEWTIEEVSSGLDLARGSQPIVPLGSPGTWYPVTLTAPVTLFSGRDYRLWFRTGSDPSASYYVNTGWHAGQGSVYEQATWGGTAARAQSSVDGGSTWTDHPDADLAFRLDVYEGPFSVGEIVPKFWVSRNVVMEDETITFRVDSTEPGPAGITIYNSAGERIRTVLHEDLAEGEVRVVTWDTLNEAGEKVVAGVYIAYFYAAMGSRIHRFIILR